MKNKRAKALYIGLCAVAGGLAGGFGVRHIDTMLLEMQPGGRFEGLHVGFLLLGLMLAAIGVFVLAMSLSRRAIAANMGIDLAVEDDVDPERRMLRLQGLVLIISGFAMIVPGFGYAPLGVGGGAAFAIVFALIIAESALNYRIYKTSDELLRRAMAEVCVITFWIFQLLIFTWAVAAQFRLIPGFAPLDIVLVMMMIYIVASVGVVMRRGIGVPGD